MSDIDLFVSYNSSDLDAIVEIRGILVRQGISSFLDRDHLVAGLPWSQALENALEDVNAVAIFLGPKGLGRWQKREMWFALDRQAQLELSGESFPVIPVLLPGADPTASFLFLNTWIDLRNSLHDSEAIRALRRAIRKEVASSISTPRPILLPYRALDVFREEHAAFFYGRDAFITKLAEGVDNHSLVAVIGPSGSGKSSVVQAGLLPILRRRRPPEPTWDVALLTPGDRPFRSLANALIPYLEPELNEIDRLFEVKRLEDSLLSGNISFVDTVCRILEKSGGTDRFLLGVDQFEELFTLGAASIRPRFLDVLLAALNQVPLTLLLTLRADFYGNALNLSRQLSDLLEEGVINLGPMDKEELRAAIVKPAESVGLRFEPGLAERILNDVVAQPGSLPLLEFALTELWNHRENTRLTHQAYDSSGGVIGAISQRAESEFEKLTSEQRLATRHIFTSLVRVAGPHQPGEDSRRRALLSDFDDTARGVIARLARARLLVTTGFVNSGESEANETEAFVQSHDAGKGELVKTVEVAHEALIRGWARLGGWLDDDRELLLWRQRLRSRAEEWEQSGKDPSTLMRGPSLTEAERWLSERPGELTENETRFILDSMDLRIQVEKDAESRRRKSIVALAFGLLVATVLTVVSLIQWNTARKQTLIAEDALAASRASEAKAVSAMKRVEWERRRAETEATEARAQAELARRATYNNQLLRATDQIENNPSYALSLLDDSSFSPEDLKDFTWRYLYRIAKRDIKTLIGHTRSVLSVVYSADGKTLASSGADSTIRLWDVDTEKELAIIQGYGRGPCLSIDLSPDGRLLASGSDTSLNPDLTGMDNPVTLWDTVSGKVIATLHGHSGDIYSVAFSPDGKTLASGAWDGSVILWDIATRQVRLKPQGHDRAVTAVAFSADGRLLASGSWDRTVGIWDVTSGERRTVLSGHKDRVTAVAFSPVGRTLAAGDQYGDIQLWDMSTGEKGIRLDAGGMVNSIVFTPDGKTVAAADQRGISVWNVNTGKKELTLPEDGGTFWSIDFSPDGKLLISGEEGGAVRFWNMGTTAHRTIRLNNLESMANIPDGNTLAIAVNGELELWDATPGRTPKIFRRFDSQEERGVQDMAFSPDGKALAVVNDVSVSLWDTDTGIKRDTEIAHSDSIYAVAFSPDGKTLATTSNDTAVGLWDAASGQQRAILLGHKAPVDAVAFSPDGKTLATGDWGHTIKVWEVSTGRELVSFREKAQSIFALAYHPNGQILAAGSLNGTVKLRDPETGKELATLSGHSGPVSSLAFTPDGRTLASGSWDGSIRLWDPVTGQERGILEGGIGEIRSVTFVSNGKSLASASDKAIKLWATEIADEGVSLESHKVTTE